MLECVCVKMFCVWHLQVVAPVRETCAQVLGVTTVHLDVDCVHIIARRIVQFLTRPEWEVRHGGLLGLKYILAARQAILNCLLALL